MISIEESSKSIFVASIYLSTHGLSTASVIKGFWFKYSPDKPDPDPTSTIFIPSLRYLFIQSYLLFSKKSTLVNLFFKKSSLADPKSPSLLIRF